MIVDMRQNRSYHKIDHHTCIIKVLGSNSNVIIMPQTHRPRKKLTEQNVSQKNISSFMK